MLINSELRKKNHIFLRTFKYIYHIFLRTFLLNNHIFLRTFRGKSHIFLRSFDWKSHFFQNKSSPVTCLLIFLAYILLYRPCGVTNVGMSVFVVFVTFLKIFRRCARWASYALVISYSPLQNFISQIEIDLSERSISRSICVPRFRSSSASSSAITLAVGR